MDDVRTLLHDLGLGHSYWAEVAAFSIDTCNLIPSRRHPGRVPLESFSGQRQGVAHLCVFGAKCWAKIPTTHGAQVMGGSKLDPRSVECRLLVYASGSGNYKVQDIASRRVFVSRDVIFEEGKPSRTSVSVGEQQIPLFNANIVPDVGTPLADTEPNPAINDGHHVPVNVDQVPNQTDRNIPMIPVEPRRSTRAPQPS